MKKKNNFFSGIQKLLTPEQLSNVFVYESKKRGESDKKLKSMLHWDVNNGIARRAWARNKEAVTAIKRAMEIEPKLKITIANEVDDNLLNSI